jgi:hypothetical protein
MELQKEGAVLIQLHPPFVMIEPELYINFDYRATLLTLAYDSGLMVRTNLDLFIDLPKKYQEDLS